MKSRIVLTLAAATLAIGGTAAYAQQTRMNPDSNGDGAISQAESQARAVAMFAKMDADKDGQLTDADRTARREEHRTRMFDSLDTNKDGNVTRAEFMAFEGHGKGMGRGKGDGDRNHRMGRKGGHGKMMEMADTNGDGRISQAEFVANSAKRFTAMDANKDGKVTKEERQAHRQEMRGKWRDKTDS